MHARVPCLSFMCPACENCFGTERSLQCMKCRRQSINVVAFVSFLSTYHSFLCISCGRFCINFATASLRCFNAVHSVTGMASDCKMGDS